MKSKSFKQQVRLSEATILEENREWYEKTVEENCKSTHEPSKKATSRKRKAFWISLCSSLAAACIVIISVLALYPSPADTPPKGYALEDLDIVEIENFDLIRNDVKDVALHFDAIYTRFFNKAYDTKSNDTLYYTIKLTNDNLTYENIVLHIYTNHDFKDRKSLSEVTETETINGLSVRYHKEIVVSDWANQITYNAIIAYKDTEIFIEYSQYSPDESSNFFHFIEQTFTIKD